MNLFGWLIVVLPVAVLLCVGFYTRRYIRDIADYLAAGRVAGRYVICVGDVSAGLSVISLVAMVESQYQSGKGLGFWSGVMIPISLILSLTGYCIYRFRQTRALSLGQFLEMRYSRSFRIVAATIRTISEMMANAIAPAVAARFFIYLLGFSHTIQVGPFAIPTFSLVMGSVIILALCLIWPGGRVSLIVTDCIQGLITYPIFVIFTVYVLTEFSFIGEMAPTLLDRAPGESFLNPYDVDKLRDFNLFALFVNIFGGILNRAAWIGNDTSTCARTPHEQKMAGILGTWRNGFCIVMCTLLTAAVFTALNHIRYADEAKNIRSTLVTTVASDVMAKDPALRDRVIAATDAIPVQKHVIGQDPPLSRLSNPDTLYLNTVRGQLPEGTQGNVIFGEFKTLYYQMMLPSMIRKNFPMVLMALFCLLMILLMISTDSARIFNASSTIVQDIIMPFRKTPFTKVQHFKALRGCTLGVCVFFFFFSLFMSQLDYIAMFLTITTSLWLGAAGPIMLGGLYTRFGTTAGAWASLVVGSGTAVSGIAIQQTWASRIYPFLENMGWVAPIGGFMHAVTSFTAPLVVWEMNAVKFPINSVEIYFLAMVGGIAAYVLFSLLSRQPKFNLDQMLHRGKYAVKSDVVVEEDDEAVSSWSFKQVYNKIVGITPEYTRGDKIITWSVLIYSLGYQFGVCFLGTIAWTTFVGPISGKGWTYYFFINSLLLPCAIGVISTVWFVTGGIIDMRKMFNDLAARKSDVNDDGWVEGNVSLADQKTTPVVVALAEGKLADDKPAEDMKR